MKFNRLTSIALAALALRRNLTAFYFLPGAGGADRGAWSCTNCVSSGERGAVIVAAGVDEHAAAAIHFVKLAREIFRITRDQELANAMSEVCDCAKIRLRVQGQLYVPAATDTRASQWQ